MIEEVKRFWAKVEKTDSCWNWKASKTKNGYGVFGNKKAKKNWLAHRYSYQLVYGQIPSGMFICHKCDNPQCVNPKHLFLGTAKSNSEDMKNKGRSAIGDKNGLRKHPESILWGKDNSNGKLSYEDVVMIRKLKLEYRASQLAERFGVCRQYIYNIWNGFDRA